MIFGHDIPVLGLPATDMIKRVVQTEHFPGDHSEGEKVVSNSRRLTLCCRWAEIQSGIGISAAISV